MVRNYRTLERHSENLQRHLDQLDKTKVNPRIDVEDRATRQMDNVIDLMDYLDRKNATPMLTADDRLTEVLDRLDKRLESIDSEKATATVDVQDNATPIIEKIQGQLDALQNVTLAVGANAAVFGTSSSDTAMFSNSQNARVSATTGVPAEALKYMIDDIYYNQKVGESRENVAISFGNIMQQTGLEDNQVKAAALVSNKLAQIHGKDVPEVDRALASMMNNFNIDAARAGDNIAYVYKNAGDAYDDLLDSFQEYASTFKDMGMTTEQVTAAFVGGYKGGARNFDDLADAMREFNIRRREMTDEQVAAFKRVLGKKEAEKMFRGFEDGSYKGAVALDKVAEGLAKIKNENERAAIATVLIGTKYEDMKEPILEMADAIDDTVTVTGELNKQWETWRDNDNLTPITDAVRDFQKTLDDTGNAIIDKVAPAFEEFSNWADSSEGKQALDDMSNSLAFFTGVMGNVFVPVSKFVITQMDWLQWGFLVIGGAVLLTKTRLLGIIPTIKGVGIAWDFLSKKFNKKGKGKGNIDEAADAVDRLGKEAKDSAKDVDKLTKSMDKLNEASTLGPRKNRGKGSKGGKNSKGGKLSTIGKGAGKAFLPLTAGLTIWDILSSSGDDRTKAISEAVGGWGGAAAGAAIGSIIPGVGTLIGGLAGGILGGLGGSAVGNKITSGGEKATAAAGTASLTKGLEAQFAAFSAKGTEYGTTFGKNFMTGVKSQSFNWFQTTIYPEMNQAVANANLFGSAFSKNFSLGANASGAVATEWLQTSVYPQLNQAVGNAELFGSAFGISFGMGVTSSQFNLLDWISPQIYQPLNTLITNSKLFGSAMIKSFIMGRDSVDMQTRLFLVNEVDLPFLDLSRTAPYWGSGMINQFISGMRSKREDVSAEAKYLAKAVEKAFRSELDIHSPSKVMFGLGRWASIGVIKGLDAVDIKKFAENQAGSLAAAFSNMGAAGGNVKSWLSAALMATGTPMSWLPALMTMAMRESGGNPHAINNWDINAKRGTPSKGLMQTIDPTFNAYKLPGMNDIWNPIHNAAAAIRYIKDRYGTVFNTPGMRNMRKGGKYKGYATGTNGPLKTSQWAWVGEEGPELMRLQKGTEIFSHRDSMKIASGTYNPADGASSAPSGLGAKARNFWQRNMQSTQSGIEEKQAPNSAQATSGSKIINQFQNLIGEVHVHNEADENRLLQKIKQLLREEIDNSGEVLTA
jgi:phage-related minor tail protein/SLT domain-containing protein